MKKKNYLLTGLKVLLLNIIAGFIMFFLNLVMGLLGIAGISALNSLSVFTIILALFFLIFALFAAIFINGYLAQKMFKWR